MKNKWSELDEEEELKGQNFPVLLDKYGVFAAGRGGGCGWCRRKFPRMMSLELYKHYQNVVNTAILFELQELPYISLQYNLYLKV